MYINSHSCRSCGTDEHVSRCNGCSITYYCSRDCQVKDWTQHKKFCKSEQEKLSKARREKCLSSINNDSVFRFLMVQHYLKITGVLQVEDGGEMEPRYLPFPVSIEIVELTKTLYSTPIPFNKEVHQKLLKVISVRNEDVIPVLYTSNSEMKVYQYRSPEIAQWKESIDRMPQELMLPILKEAAELDGKILENVQAVMTIARLSGTFLALPESQQKKA